MAEKKVTVMVLKVDLQCYSCYRKVKKVLCKFPQIRNQVYDEKQNTVTITVVCCSPEKIRDKLCYKGANAIKSIEIKEPTKAKEPEKTKAAEKPKEPEKAKAQEKPKEAEKPKESEKPKAAAEKPKSKPPAEKPVEKSPKADAPKNPAPAPVPASAPKAVEPVAVNMHVAVQGYPPMPIYPGGVSYGPFYEGYAVGPYYNGYGTPAPPPAGPYYDGYGYEYGYGYGGNKRSGSSDYFSEENPQGCTIM